MLTSPRHRVETYDVSCIPFGTSYGAASTAAAIVILCRMTRPLVRPDETAGDDARSRWVRFAHEAATELAQYVNASHVRAVVYSDGRIELECSGKAMADEGWKVMTGASRIAPLHEALGRHGIESLDAWHEHTLWVLTLRDT